MGIKNLFGFRQPEKERSLRYMRENLFVSIVKKGIKHISTNTKLTHEITPQIERLGYDYKSALATTISDGVSSKQEKVIERKKSCQQIQEGKSTSNTSQEVENTVPQYISEPEGLPNIGNTCHLNSLLQFLFSASKYRSIMLSIRSKAHETCTAFLIAQLFTILEKNKQKTQKQERDRLEKSKKNLLNQFVVNLEQMNLTYIRYQQEDVFETLNNIVHNLDPSSYPYDEQNQIKELFGILVQKQCPCLDQPVIFQSTYFTKDQRCEACRQIYEQVYLNSPEYLIVSDTILEEQLYLSEGQGSSIENHIYSFVSSIIYSGNGRFGHYICLRKHNNRLFQISDSFVTEKNMSDLQFYSLNKDSNQRMTSLKRPIVSLYQKKQKKEKNEQILEEPLSQKNQEEGDHQEEVENFIGQSYPYIMAEALSLAWIIYKIIKE